MSYPADPPPYTPTPDPNPSVEVIHAQPAPDHDITTPVPIDQPVGSTPTVIVCRSCHYRIITNIEIRPSSRTHLWAACLLGMRCWPCMCIPYCTPVCMNVDHYCPNCNAFIGKHENWKE